jgi:N-succinyl-L-ornithine transcarbamylase
MPKPLWQDFLNMLPFLLYMEGATGHPLQSLADAITMEEFKTDHRPKVVLSWAPHPKALLKLSPICANDAIARRRFCHYTSGRLRTQSEITKDSKIEYDQNKAFENADFIYTKNWSSYKDYGKITNNDTKWTVTADKMKLIQPSSCTVCPLDVT